MAAQDSIHYSDTKGRNLFAIRVADDSMMPVFKIGDYAIINPNMPAATGALVAVKILNGDGEENPTMAKSTLNRLPVDRLIVRVLEKGPEGLWARPLNRTWNAIKVNLETPSGIISDRDRRYENSLGEVIGRVVERKRIYA